ncbi:Eco57I restriction-modification methylase domain-containing protein [Haliangium sp.]|uniref:Eco57I restriction-modification methylase domain-containing protein n=1 Tax=Haliangium sp. TaxID=2663208 RepID=UPI003D117719
MDPARRLILGQWFTPPAVADLALSLAVPAGVAPGRLRVLDPACGDGVFLARARARGVGTEAGGTVCGIDLDPVAAAVAQARVAGARVVEGDLFEVAPDDVGGLFDVVVGNPPYVRQERLSGARKRRIEAVLRRDLSAGGDDDAEAKALAARLVGRGDLAAACIVRALTLARPGARVALVVSSALLDADYAAALWTAVARLGRVRALVDAPRERWFADAAINAVIVVIERGPDPRARADAGGADEVVLARLRMDTEQAAARVRPGELDQLAEVAELRRAEADQPERWAAGLRAPQAWFEVERVAGPGLVPLGRLAEVRRGVTSGANGVFYLTRARAATLGIEPAVLAPVLRSPRRQRSIAVEPDQVSHLALVCPSEPAALDRFPVAREYLHEHRAVAGRRTLRGRRPWWALPARPARLFMTKAYGARFVQHLARTPMVADQRVYTVEPCRGVQDGAGPEPARERRAEVDVELLAAVLNSTFTALAIESLGRASMGEGALEWTVADALRLPVLDPRRLDRARASAARRTLVGMAGRSVGDLEGERAAPDRARLDAAVAAACPDLRSRLNEVWAALIDSVTRRHARVGRR